MHYGVVARFGINTCLPAIAAVHQLVYNSFMTQKVLRAAAWLTIAFILFITVSPIGLRPHNILPVNVDRALAFMLTVSSSPSPTRGTLFYAASLSQSALS